LEVCLNSDDKVIREMRRFVISVKICVLTSKYVSEGVKICVEMSKYVTEGVKMCVEVDF